MSQRTELFTVRNFFVVVLMLRIQLNEFRVIGYFRQLGHDRERVALGALLAGLAVAILTRRSEVAPRLEVAAELSR